MGVQSPSSPKKRPLLPLKWEKLAEDMGGSEAQAWAQYGQGVGVQRAMGRSCEPEPAWQELPQERPSHVMGSGPGRCTGVFSPRGFSRENRWGDCDPSNSVTTVITAGSGVKGVGPCRYVCACATWFLGTQNSRFPGPEAPQAHSSHGGLSPKYLTGGL